MERGMGALPTCAAAGPRGTERARELERVLRCVLGAAVRLWPLADGSGADAACICSSRRGRSGEHIRNAHSRAEREEEGGPCESGGAHLTELVLHARAPLLALAGARDASLHSLALLAACCGTACGVGRNETPAASTGCAALRLSGWRHAAAGELRPMGRRRLPQQHAVGWQGAADINGRAAACQPHRSHMDSTWHMAAWQPQASSTLRARLLAFRAHAAGQRPALRPQGVVCEGSGVAGVGLRRDARAARGEPQARASQLQRSSLSAFDSGCCLSVVAAASATSGPGCGRGLSLVCDSSGKAASRA